MSIEDQPLHTIPDSLHATVIDRVDDVQDVITRDIEHLMGRTAEMVALAKGAVLGIADTLQESPYPGTPNRINVPLPSLVNRPDISLRSLGDVSLQGVGSYVSTLQGINFDTDFNVEMPDTPTGEPSISLPAAPNVTFNSAPVAPVIDTSITIPAAPNVALPSMPPMHGVTLPVLPTISLPTLNVELPTWDVADPNFQNIVSEVGPITLDEDTLNQFIQKTLGDVPATLLTVTREEVDRIADQHQAQAKRDIEAVFEEFSSHGFTAPPGALGRRADVIRADAAAKIRLASRDVAIDRMKVELEAYRTNLTTGAELATKQLDLFLQSKRLTMDVVVSMGKQMVDFYNAQIAVFNAKQSGYQALVDVYKAKIQGELSKVDLYKANVEGVQAGVEVDKAAIQGYTAQVQGAMSAVEIYKAVVEAAKTELETKAKQMDMFRSEVEAYVAQVNAAKARYDVYDSQVKASMAPLEIYVERMKAYGVSADVAKTKMEAHKVKADVVLGREEANLKAYSANVDAIIKQNSVMLENARLEADIIRAELAVQVENAKLLTEDQRLRFEAYKSQVQESLAAFEANIKQWQTLAELAQQRAALRVEAAKASASASAQMASAAMAGFHVQKSISSSAGLGFSGSSSGSWNYSKSENTNTSA